MPRIRIYVTVGPQHLEKAVEAYRKGKRIPTCCPVSQALKEKFVGLIETTPFDANIGGVCYTTSPNLKKAIRDHDDGRNLYEKYRFRFGTYALYREV